MVKQEPARDKDLAGAQRLRALLAVAAMPLLAGYAAVAALLAVIAALATQATFSPGQILLAAAPGWLGAHQVPLTLSGQPLAMLPLTVSVIMGVLLARSAAGAAERLEWHTPQQAVTIVATMAGAHAVAGVTVAIASRSERLTADPLTSFVLPGV
ncbi:MAG: cell division protein PerM, partial [Thermocrispum sp.]